MDLAAEKRTARAEIRQRRAARSSRHGAAFASQLAQLCEELGAARVCAFVGSGAEPDTSAFIDWAVARGIEVLLPRSLADGTLDWAALDERGLAPGRFGIPEPVGEALGVAAVLGADLVLVPAAAVDRSGARLGWGRGYYDRALAPATGSDGSCSSPVFAVVFEDEVLDTLPSEPHDVPVRGAITEERIHRFG